MTTRQKPANATHWSTRTLAETLGTNRSMISRVWRANELKPHLSRTFKVSNDPKFAEKLVDVVRLYLDPPELALVLCVDEKSPIEALDRTRPSLPIYTGRCETRKVQRLPIAHTSCEDRRSRFRCRSSW